MEARGGKEERRKHTETQLGLTLPSAREVSLKTHSRKVKSSSVWAMALKKQQNKPKKQQQEN